MSAIPALDDELAATVESVDGVFDWRVAPEDGEVEFLTADRPARATVVELSDADVSGTLAAADDDAEDPPVYRLDFGVPVRRSPASLSLSGGDSETGDEGPWSITVELARVDPAD